MRFATYLVHDRQRAMMLEETIANAKESVGKLWLETADCRKAPKFLNWRSREQAVSWALSGNLRD